MYQFNYSFGIKITVDGLLKVLLKTVHLTALFYCDIDQVNTAVTSAR